jgi:branched-chain amino acid transport system substrate-binding protein
VLNDQSSLYADISGQGSVAAARLASEDFGAAKKGMKVEIVFADHQNKPDVGSAIARKWYDAEGVDVIVDVPTSSVALAINEITKEKNKAFLVSGAATSDLSGKACSPNTIHWTYDTWMLANGTGSAIVKTGGDSWFFYRRLRIRSRPRARHRGRGAEVGRQGSRQGAPPAELAGLLVVPAAGAVVEGEDHRPRERGRRHDQLDQAGLGVRHRQGGQALAGMLVFISDVHGLGLDKAQGLIFTETFYWDRNDESRAWTKRYLATMKDKYPTMVHAGVYSAVLHYLKAVEALKSDDGGKVIAKMKEMPTDDTLFGKGRIARTAARSTRRTSSK